MKKLTLLFLILLPAVVRAQSDDVDAQLRRIFASRDFAQERFGPARWLDGSNYTTLERSATGNGTDIVKYDAATSQRTVLVDASQIGAVPIADYSWSDDGTRLLIFTNTERVWRDETRGDYYVLDRTTGAFKKLGGADAEPSTLMFAKFTPDGTRVGYVRDGDIYVEDVAGSGITRLTNTASGTIVNGTTDWVYEEEFYLRDAFSFSPDGKRVAYWQFDMSGVRDFLLINNTDSLYSFTIPIQYPKVGTTNSAVRVGTVSASGGPTTWINVPGDLRDNYVPRMNWVSPAQLIVQRVNRLQNTNRLLIADAATGSVRDVVTERDSAWLDVVNDLQLLDNGRRFLWISERDGWRHLYSVAIDGSNTRLLTEGGYDVIPNRRTGPAVATTHRFIYVMASPENATQRYLYRFPLRGGKGTRVTPQDQPGTHQYQISPDGKYAFHVYSTIDAPPVIDLIELPAHRVVRTLVKNERLRAAVTPLIHRKTEFFKVNIGNGIELDGWLFLPKNFDGSKKYPLLMHVYTEPAGTTVDDSWGGGGDLWHRMLADQGYVVASVDNRGTPAPKGRAWRKVIYGQIGILAAKEQADAVRALIAQRPYIDGSRVGVWGWSGGGSATLNAMFKYPDVYHVGMSVAPVPDQHLYDTVYQERYMGLPSQNVEGFRRGSPINFAEGLRGKLLLMHGTGDDNVHFQGSERLVNRLIELNKQFDFMAYPNRSHCICEGAGTTLHVYTTMTRYLLGNLPPAK